MELLRKTGGPEIIIKEYIYPNGASTRDVYNWLTRGAKEGGSYPYHKGSSDKWGYNYGTPRHHFEDWTAIQMYAFLETLERDLKHGKYAGRRWYKKWH